MLDHHYQGPAVSPAQAADLAPSVPTGPFPINYYYQRSVNKINPESVMYHFKQVCVSIAAEWHSGTMIWWVTNCFLENGYCFC